MIESFGYNVNTNISGVDGNTQTGNYAPCSNYSSFNYSLSTSNYSTNSSQLQINKIVSNSIQNQNTITTNNFACNNLLLTQQDNIGQYNDVSYLLSLTATMRALLYEYSSSSEDTIVYTPANMTKAQWLVVIRRLWSSFKDKLSYNRQTEYQHVRSLYPAVRHKPYSGKIVKANSGPVTSMTIPATIAKAQTVAARVAVAVTPVRTKRGKDKKSAKSSSPSRSPSPSSSRGKKVEFGVAICISDLAKQ